MVTYNSELASIRFPAWQLRTQPQARDNKRAILDLPIKFSLGRSRGRTRRAPNDVPWTRGWTRIRRVRSPEHNERGGFTAAGVGGGITGRALTSLIIDDPLKNMEEADSIDRRDLLDEWCFQSTAYTSSCSGWRCTVY